MRKGMSRYEIKQILEEKIESEPDLKYYLDNEYTIKISTVCNCISDFKLHNGRKKRICSRRR